ncbi:MAG: hypothetical protein WC922_10190 [Synergistaceae bacterium]|jgi:hypothetical protein
MENKGKVELKQTGVKVKLAGVDGNAFVILGHVCQALRNAGYGGDFIAAFRKEATSGDYNHLLMVCMKTVEVE